MKINGNAIRFHETGELDVLTLENNECKAYVLERIKSGKLKPLVGKVFDFKDYKKAYEYMLSNEQIGKIVVTINNKK